MKKIKRILACALALCIALGMASCAPKDDNTEGQSGTTSNDVAKVSSADTATGPIDIWASFPETVTLSTVLPASNANKFLEGEDYDKNPWYDQFKAKFNIDLKNLWVATSADYTTKLNLAIADDSLPDVFTVGSVGDFNQLVDEGVAMDITEVFNNYASDDVKSYMENDPETTNTAFRDGKMYAIPQLSFGIINQPRQIWIRKDWKEEQKIADPKTMDDIVAMARIFKEKYNAVGIGEDQKLDSMNFLAPAWGAYPGLWLDTPNGVEYGSVQPEMKDVLSTFASWYKEGLLYRDFTTSDMTKMLQTNINGTSGIQPFHQWLAWTEIDVVKNNGEGTFFQAYPIPSANGEIVKSPITFANDGYIVINKNCKNPEAALKLINYYAKITFENSDDEDQDIIDKMEWCGGNVPYAFRVYDSNTDYDQYVAMGEAVEKRDPSKLVGGGAITKYENIIKFLDTKEPEAVGDYLQVGDEKCAYSVSKKILDDGHIIKNVLWGASPQTLADTGSTLDDILIQGFTQIIVGEEPVDYFDKLVESWKKAGGENATKEMNELYGKK